MKVEAISQNDRKTKLGIKPVYGIKCDDGQWYNLGFNKPTFAKGDEIDFEFTNDRFGNQVKFETIKINGSAVSKSAAPSTRSFPRGGAGVTADSPYATRSARPFPIPLTHGDRSIVRQNALTNARELIISNDYFMKNKTGQFLNSEELAREVVRIAHIFESYSAGDEERRAAEKTKGE